LQKNSIAAFCILLLHLVLPAFADLGEMKTIFQNGEKAFRNNNFEMAASHFARAIKLAPQDIRTRFRYGQSLFSLHRFNESYSQFQTVLENSPNNIIARVYLSENLIKLGRTEEAAAHLQWILKVQPGHARASELLGEIKNPGKESIPDGFQPLPVKDVELTADDPKIDLDETAKQVKPGTRDVSSFISENSNSFLVNLEYGRYAIEKGDLVTARERLKMSERLAKEQQDTRRFLEVQILTSLVYVYSKDFLAFGKHLMKLKPLLSEKSYQSFLDIYNQARELKTDSEITRLSSGVAMGAGHYAVAAELLKKALEQSPGDDLLLNLLAEAQMQNLDYSGAEITLSEIARQDQKNAESYFNLGRFYLTASYRPDMARKCSEYGRSLKPQDPRFSVLLALLDYSEGKIDTGVARLQQLLPQLDDPAFKSVCQRIINDGRYADSNNGSSRIDFAEIMALPGANHAPKSSFRLIATDYLKRGSFFSAMRYFMMAQDLAEVGRTYLGLSSALHLSKEERPAAIAAGYGLKALNEELVRNPQSARANLYLALYHFERDELMQAGQAVKRGLSSDADRNTRQRLTALLETIAQPEKMMKKN
jgi:tetratricopeptide (TPR) repeat protein